MTPADAGRLDLRGTACPLNYVKTRLELDRLEPGASIEVWLDRGEPEEQVPRSLRMDGHIVEVLSPGAAHARLRVIRGGAGRPGGRP
ncbi:MAG: sulfurtransferase TusA family protein [Candidatus Dormibacteria bacterium]